LCEVLRVAVVSTATGLQSVFGVGVELATAGPGSGQGPLISDDFADFFFSIPPRPETNWQSHSGRAEGHAPAMA